jgi:hypothetical protein
MVGVIEEKVLRAFKLRIVARKGESRSSRRK